MRVIGVTIPIDINSTNLNNLTGHPVNVPKNQGTSTSGYMRVNKLDGSGRVQLLQWKVTGSGVIISVYRLSSAVVEELVQRFGSEALSTGIRFSNGLRTQDTRLVHKDNFDTAWLFFQETIGKWYSDQRGFQNLDGWIASDTGAYKPGASAANEFDNILKIPGAGKKAKREIYVNHIDEQGNVISGLEHSSLNMVTPAGTTRASTNPKYGYQEHYTIESGETIGISKSGITEIGDTTYKFIRGEAASASTLAAAKTRILNANIFWNTDISNVTTSGSNVDDFYVVNLIYSKYTPLNVPLEIVGRLEFINRDSQYIGSTVNHDTDYIPSTKQLTPFIQGAYPYAVRAIRYETNKLNYSSTATIKITIDYSWQYWVFEHHDKEVCESSTAADGTTTTTCHMEHTSACKYYSYTGSSSKSKTYSYTVPFTHTWFNITNFKLYRISKLEVYDTNNNIGGTLFGGGTYTVNPSSGYESRFNNSRGKIDNIMLVSFPSSSYSLSSIYKSASSPGSGESDASSAAQAALDAVTAKVAADHENLTISYQYDNDYIELDGATDMLQRNYKNWSEHIIKETDAVNVRDLDSTRTGTGQINGSLLSYTSNLMNYMKPQNKLTDDSDFTPNYQTVPANRENGLRLLSGKVYYNITNDSKYNVGLNTFDSTDQTYKLNNLYKLANPDFLEQTKDYINNDVNKVNVLTPVNFGNFELITAEKVDHTSGAGNATILQKNAEFSITPLTSGSNTAGYNLSDTREFVKGYYYSFDFNIIYNGREIPAYSPTYIAGASSTFKAKTTDSFSSGAAAQLTNSVKIVAITTNITDALKQILDTQVSTSNKYMDYLKTATRNTGTQNQSGLLSRSDIKNDAYHAVYKAIVTKNVGRIFDFAVTDCTDLAFKDVFRKPNSINVNETTGVSYYAGYRKWNLYSSEYNEMIDRTDVGSDPQKILPLGPYKNINNKYINAPKMGYRISFDLKTTGFMDQNNINNTRRVEIIPKYYYISKDGKTFDNNIKLYYKNSTGKYVDYLSSGYTIYYKPNDGYRYLRNSAYTDDYTLMSTKLEALTISSKLVLTNKMMSSNNTSFIQAWYGEFKLPNSTIAISNVVGSPNNNVNNSYKDGYIGVIFDVKCIDTGGFTLSYDTSDKSSGSSVNTSQWDYEGFMNFKTPGSPTNILRYQLEKDSWQIDDSRYQQIKGTVVLFDLDNRASDDFE